MSTAAIATFEFDEAAHPRDSHGRFGDGSDEPGMASLAAFIDAHPEMTAKLGPADYPQGFNRDGRLETILAARGFDGTPHIVTADEAAKLVEQGYTPIYRGLDNQAAVDDLRACPYYGGSGVFGNGNYFSTDRARAEEYTYPAGQYTPAPERVVDGFLPPNANVISREDLTALHISAGTAYANANPGSMKDRTNPYMPLGALGDPGRFAAAMGYDAIAVARPRDAMVEQKYLAPAEVPQGDAEVYYNVLNRSVLSVVDAPLTASGFATFDWDEAMRWIGFDTPTARFEFVDRVKRVAEFGSLSDADQDAVLAAEDRIVERVSDAPVRHDHADPALIASGAREVVTPAEFGHAYAHARKHVLPGIEAAYAAAARRVFERHAKRVAARLRVLRRAAAVIDVPITASAPLRTKVPPAIHLRAAELFMDDFDRDFRDELEPEIEKQSRALGILFVGASWGSSAILAHLTEGQSRRLDAVGTAAYDRVDGALASAYANGATFDEMTTAIANVFDGFSGWLADRVAGDEAAATMNGVATGAALWGSVQASRRWVSQGDALVRDAHDEADGQERALDEPFEVDGEMLDYPGDPNGTPGNVINCVIGSTTLDAPAMRYAMRSWYEGEVVVLRFASGRDLTVTPNHPTLRADGQWVAAGDLVEGNYCIGGRIVRHLSGKPNERGMPSEAAAIYGAATLASVAQGIYTGPTDLHGEGRDRQVEVVPADRGLCVNVEAASDEQINEFGLAAARLARASLGSSERTVDAAIAWVSTRGASDRVDVRTRSACLVCGGGERTTLGGGRVSHSQFHPGSTIARHDPGVDDMSPDYGSRHAVRVGDGTLCLSRDVSSDAFIVERDRLSAASLTHDAAGPQECVCGGTAGADLYGRSIERQPVIDVAPDEIIGIERQRFSGHVYNLDTGHGWYFGNSIALRNCRCYLEFIDAEGNPLVADDAVNAEGDAMLNDATSDGVDGADGSDGVPPDDTLNASATSTFEFDEEAHPRGPDGRFGDGEAPAWAPVLAASHAFSDDLASQTYAAMEAAGHGPLANAIGRFQSGDKCPQQIRNAIEGQRVSGYRGITAKDFKESGGQIKTALSTAPPNTVETFRGMAIKGSTADVAAAFAVGTTHDWGVASFSANRGVAEEFATHARTFGAFGPEVVVKLDAGATTVPIQNLSAIEKWYGQEEHLAGGRFEVTSMEVREGAAGTQGTVRVGDTERTYGPEWKGDRIEVTMKQVNTL